jgi:hypothetical protein
MRGPDVLPSGQALGLMQIDRSALRGTERHKVDISLGTVLTQKQLCCHCCAML